uniref:Uncharacterized protein n=1 Tax=Vannella robusta TaxID=1487602 RepID=A0A7S4IQN6_9EUKA|mmetsp:Transcript_6937/g.8623  ORF Transcript_6937/g.8623 Transcript_6937/m.8623 type:complete len:114 (+) Transcript_6937:228-569(+)
MKSEPGVVRMEFITILDGMRVAKAHEYGEGTIKEAIIADLADNGVFPDPVLLAKFEEKKRQEDELHRQKLIRDGLLDPQEPQTKPKRTMTPEDQRLHQAKLKRDGYIHTHEEL